MNNLKEKITKLFKEYNFEGSATQQLVCRYFETKDINDLCVLRVSKLNSNLRKELYGLLRYYFKSLKKEVAQEVEVQEQPRKFVPEDSNGICTDLTPCSCPKQR